MASCNQNLTVANFGNYFLRLFTSTNCRCEEARDRTFLGSADPQRILRNRRNLHLPK